MTELLAKRPLDGRSLSLERHSRDTEEVAQRLFAPERRWYRNWLRFFRIPAADAHRLLPNLQVAGLLHDLGKANAEFQQLVQPVGGKRSAQTLRHEHLSALILSLPEVRQWLASSPVVDVDVVTAAVLSHHLKASGGHEYQWGMPRTERAKLPLLLAHPEVRSILARVREVAQIDSPTPMLPSDAWSLASPWEDARAQGLRNAIQFGRAIRRDRELGRKRLLLAVKAGVIVADSVASGLVRTGLPIEAWIDEVAHAPALGPADVADKVVSRRIDEIARRSGRPFAWHRFQDLAAEQGPRALLLAGCGAGKTLAAWRWAHAQVAAHEVGRVIFLYPTRGTATEGFRDYVGWAPEADAALMHGTARYELEAMRDNPPDSLEGKLGPRDEATERLYALGFWPRRFFSATVDRFLAFMEHDYGSLCLLPVLADSVVVFDEVHSYDPRMFRNLLAFLEAFDVPVLCMTATLPPHRRRQLEDRGRLCTFPGVEHRAQLLDLEQQEERERYLVRRVDDDGQARATVVDAFRGGGRVLWVVNTVARCQRVADELAAALGEDVLVYHSRFCLRHRHAAHERTVAAFQQTERPALAVTTQVCEMSLDLDADVLVTELAPVTALVQRFGRSNRSASREADFRAHVLWYEAGSPLPYTREELDAGRAFLGALEGRAVSQRTLSEALEHHAPEQPREPDGARFLDSGYYATPGSLREEDGYTTPAVLDGELDEVLAAWRSGESIDGFVVPVPRGSLKPRDDEPRAATLPRYLGVAPSERYSPTRGFVARVTGGGEQ